MYIFAEPVTEEQIDEIQSHNDAKIQEFENSILGIARHQDGSDKDTDGDAGWDDIQANVESAMDNDELGIDETREGGDTESQEQAQEPSQQELFGEGPLLANKDDQDGTPSTSADLPHEEDNVPERIDGDKDDLTEEQRAKAEKSQVENSDKGAAHTEADQSLYNTKIKDPADSSDVTRVSSAPSNCGFAEKSSVAIRKYPAARAYRVIHNSSTKAEESPSQDQDARSEDELHSNEAHAISNQNLTKANSTTSSPHQEASSEDQVDSNEADAPFLEQMQPEEDASHDILAMTLTLRNKVNGAFVLRPEKLTSSDIWSIEYSLINIPNPNRAWALYQACQARRKGKLDAGLEDEDAEKVDYYIQKLRNMSARGRVWRKDWDEAEKGRPVQVLGQKLSNTE